MEHVYNFTTTHCRCTLNPTYRVDILRVTYFYSFVYSNTKDVVIQQGSALCEEFTTQSRLLTTWKRRFVLKTLWEKEKRPVTSIFSFSRNVLNTSQKRIANFNLHLFFRLQFL